MKTLITTIVLFMLQVAVLRAQTVTNVSASQTEDDRIVITYDLVGESYQTFTVSLLLSRDGGASFAIAPRTVSGDVGEKVQPGAHKKIVWDVLMDLSRLQGSNFVFRVTATSRGGINFVGKAGIEWVFIRGGSFEMGDNFGDGTDDEKPVHTVTISDFYLSRYEVTVAQYRTFCQTKSRQMPPAPDWGWQDNHPIVNVSWDDAVAFCQWAGGRLPTEAEWEYAARAGGKIIKYPNGNSINHDDANYDGTGGRDRWESTSPVGSFPPNGLGLYDMAGNVFEWCQDRYHANYYGSSPPLNPRGPSSGVARVLRGGSWGSSPGYLRCAIRGAGGPTIRNNYYGFRCSQDVR